MISWESYLPRMANVCRKSGIFVCAEDRGAYLT